MLGCFSFQFVCCFFSLLSVLFGNFANRRNVIIFLVHSLREFCKKRFNSVLSQTFFAILNEFLDAFLNPSFFFRHMTVVGQSVYRVIDFVELKCDQIKGSHAHQLFMITAQL